MNQHDMRKRALKAAAGFAAVILTLAMVASSALAQETTETEGTQEPPAPQSTPEEQMRVVPPTLRVPAGTLVTVRVTDFLSSDHSKVGDPFSAVLEQPIVVDGWVLARRGQTVVGQVAVAKKAGRIKGVSQLGVTLTSLVLVDGQQLAVRTQLIHDTAGTSKGRDASAIGTTTGVGTLIGAAAHGGEGAAIGAGAGAAAGIIGVLLTRGRPTILPPETSLTFQLQSSLEVSTARSRIAFRPVNPQDYGPSKLARRPHPAGPPYPPPPPYYYGGPYYPRP